MRQTKILSMIVDTELTEEELAQVLEDALGEQSRTIHISVARHSNYCDVLAFALKFGVPMALQPSLLSPELYEFRQKFLQEELDEFAEAHDAGDLLKAADALVDLVYVALGTAQMMGLPWHAHWRLVQSCNMAKEPALHSLGSGCYWSSLKVIKPPGWTPPDHSSLLGYGPWPVFDGLNKKEQEE